VVEEETPTGVAVPKQHAWFIGTYSIFIATLLFAAAGVGLVFQLTGNTTTSRAEFRYDTHGARSYQSCQNAVASRLDLSSVADFPSWDSEEVIGERLRARGDVVTVRIHSHTDVDDFGTVDRIPWTCVARDVPEQSDVTHLEIDGTEIRDLAPG